MVDNLLELNANKEEVNIDNELKPTMHPNGISEGITLKQVLSDKELFDYLVEAI